MVDPRQLTLAKSDDPLGNAQPSAEIALQRDAAAVLPGIFVVQHGGQRLKIVIANAAADVAEFFEMDPDRPGKVLVEYT